MKEGIQNGECSKEGSEEGKRGGKIRRRGCGGLYPVELQQDAGLALAVAEGGVRQAGAAAQEAPLELAGLLLHAAALLVVELPGGAQLVLLLLGVIVPWGAERGSGPGTGQGRQRQAERETGRKRDREKERQTETDREKERQRQTDREKERQIDRERETE